MRIFEFADFLLDESEGVLYRRGQPVPLAPKVFDTLFVLVKNQGRVVSKDALMKEVWGSTFVEENNLTQYVFILRKTLGETEQRKFIETVSRRGYRFLPEVAVSEKQASPVQATEAEARRNAPPRARSRLIALLAVVGLLAVVSVGFFLRRDRGARVWAADKIKIKRLSENGKIYAADLSPDGTSYVYVLRDGANFSLRLKNIQTESEIVLLPPDAVEISSTRFSPDGNYIYYAKIPLNSTNEIFRIPVYGGEPRRVAGNSQSGFSLSPDGREIAFPRIVPAEKKHQIVVADSDGGGERVVAERAAPLFYHLWGPAPAWVADGTKLIVSAGSGDDDEHSELVEINLTDGGERPLRTSQPFYFVNFLEPLGDGALMISAAPDRQSKQQLFRVRLSDGEARPVTNDLSDYLTISFSQKSERLLTIQRTGNFHLWLFDAESNAARQLTFGENRYDGIAGVSIAPDNKILYTAREVDETNIFELDAETGETRRLTKHAGRNFEPAVAPDASSIVFVSDRTGFEHLWIMNRDGSGARQLTFAADNKKILERSPNFSPDGRSVYYLYYPVPFGKVYKMSIDGGAPVSVTPEDKDLFQPALSPDGKRLSVSEIMNDGAKIGVFSTEDPSAEEKIFDFPAYRTYSRWMPDSNTLVTINHNNEGNNLVLHNLLNGDAKMLTDFTAERCERFAVSKDGVKFVIVRGNWATDAVLLEH